MNIPMVKALHELNLLFVLLELDKTLQMQSCLFNRQAVHEQET
jgi:hypothetical protein